MTKNIHVVGTGTIGEPLIGLFARKKDILDIERVSFHKRTPHLRDRSKVYQLVKSGAILATDEEKASDFRQLQMEPQLSALQALEEADVVIDCTPAGNANRGLYTTISKPQGFIAQGSEHGFGKMYARGINDRALVASQDKFIHVVSCNTHTLTSLIRTFGFLNGRDCDNFISGNFYCVRRANDTSQSNKFTPAPTIEKYDDALFGTHHAKDAHDLYNTMAHDLNLFSSAIKTNTQYMHVVHFDLAVKENLSKDGLIDLIDENEFIARTYKKAANEIFSFGRDHGFYGRIFNHSVINPEVLHVRQEADGYHLRGTCFTPQDGNSLLSSVAAALWLLDPDSYEAKLTHLQDYMFCEI